MSTTLLSTHEVLYCATCIMGPEGGGGGGRVGEVEEMWNVSGHSTVFVQWTPSIVTLDH